jgi:glucose/arabinose dehydrogenase/phage baseplate assembly protein gpV
VARHRAIHRLILGSVLALAAAFALPASAGATLAANFQDNAVVSGLTTPTVVRFAPDGDMFVATQGGQIYWYPSAAGGSATLVADLGNEVYDFADRGLLGLAIDPQYPKRPYIYALYTYPSGLNEPLQPWNDGCPAAYQDFTALATGTACVATGRLSQLTINLATHQMASEKMLIQNEWCDAFRTHSIGDLQFGPDGALYASAGAGGMWGSVTTPAGSADYGEEAAALAPTSNPMKADMVPNPCGDPDMSSGPGTGTIGSSTQNSNPATAEGGMLRAQSFLRPSDQPATLDGTVIRVDPDTGNPMPGNPNSTAPDIDRQRIVAFGFRQPFRWTFFPGTTDMWVGDVGESTWEAIDHDPTPLVAPTENFGWPCYEGGNQHQMMDYADGALTGLYYTAGMCVPLQGGAGTQPSFFSYSHGSPTVATGDTCSNAHGSAVSGLGFLHGGPWPAQYNGALLFADVERDCIWEIPSSTPGQAPIPADAANITPIEQGTGTPVDLELGPEGDLYYADIADGTIRRLSYAGYPVAVGAASTGIPVTGASVQFSGAGSTAPPDAPSTPLTFHWDFGDGQTADTANATHAYAVPGDYTATLTVTAGTNSDTTTVLVHVLPLALSSISSASPTSGVAPLAVAFTGDQSTSPSPNPSFHWDFGDGQGASTADATHTYTVPGTYTATLTVSQTGQQSASTQTIHVAAPSTQPPITTPGPTVTAPVLSGLLLRPLSFHTWATSRTPGPSSHGRGPRGARFRFTLSESATVTLSFARRIKTKHGGVYMSIRAPGVAAACHRVGRRRVCRRPSTATITFRGRGGPNSDAFSGWVGGIPLPAGRYQVSVVALGPGSTQSRPQVAYFVIR